MTRFAVVVVVLAMGAACAGEAGPDSATAVYVDVAALEDAGDLGPVGGIRTGGQPDADGFKSFAEAGYEVVIDMRGADEDRGIDDEAALVEDLGMKYIALPITDENQIDFDTAAALDDMLKGFNGPVLIHCASSNRVGALLALRESLNGASDEAALDFGKQAGMTRLEPVVRERLDSR